MWKGENGVPASAVYILYSKNKNEIENITTSTSLTGSQFERRFNWVPSKHFDVKVERCGVGVAWQMNTECSECSLEYSPSSNNSKQYFTPYQRGPRGPKLSPRLLTAPRGPPVVVPKVWKVHRFIWLDANLTEWNPCRLRADRKRNARHHSPLSVN